MDDFIDSLEMCMIHRLDDYEQVMNGRWQAVR